MKPVIALVGRPNVGKSTLFNRLTRTREALVADFPGLTRDRKYGKGTHLDYAYIVIDTGGLGENQHDIDDCMTQQSWAAVKEADFVFFLVDGRAGLTHADREIAQQLRQLHKQVYVLVNKVDGIDGDSASAEFYQLGFETVFQIAASHGRGVSTMLTEVFSGIDPEQFSDDVETLTPAGVRIAVVGRPNVGKSTLVNRMLGEERVLVFDMPGTTRDSIYIPYQRRGKDYVLIDTAGVRRRGKVTETVEKFSVIKSLQAIADANVVLLVMDASEGLVEQDLHLLGHIIDCGRALVLVLNKWDGLAREQKDFVKNELKRRLVFANFAEIHFVSALHGTGVGDLYDSIETAYQSSRPQVSTSFLTKLLEDAVSEHQPPLVRGRRIKLRYAHLGGNNPPIIVVHGNQVDKVPDAYRRYLENVFHKALRLKGTPLRVEFKGSDNPYADKKKKTTPLQQQKTKRQVKRRAGKPAK